MSDFVSWQVNAGQIFEIVALLGGYAFIGLTINSRVTGLETDIKQLAEVVTQLAVQHQRLDRLEDDVREMRHGAGFVINPPPPHGYGKA